MENQNIEYKEKWNDDYLRWICGFANANGGTLFIGKDDSGTVKGIENPQKLCIACSNSNKCLQR